MLAFLLAATAVRAWWLGPTLVALCYRAEGRIVVDGKLDDPAWRGAAWASGFVLLGSGEPARAQTLFATLYDSRSLYIAVECIEPNVKGIVACHKERDSSVWFDDAVEVFVDPRHSHHDYFQFIVNTLGAKFDSHRTDWSWNGEWEAVARVGQGSWTLELAIPFSTLGIRGPAPWMVIGFNVCRDRQPGGGEKIFEWSSWAPLMKGFHEPRNFGHLAFVPPGASLPPADWLLALDEGGRGVRAFLREGVLEFAPYAVLAEKELRRRASEIRADLEEATKELRRSRLSRKEREELEALLSELWRRLILLEAPLKRRTAREWAKARLELRRLMEEARRAKWRVKFAVLFGD